MNLDFWETCARESVVIIPIIAYSKYNSEGNLSDEDRLGVKYIGLGPINNDQVIDGSPDRNFWLYIDLAVTDSNLISDTPEGALKLYLQKQQRS